MSARTATFGVFFVNGAAIGVWVAQIPFVQDRFDLSKSTLGLILLTMSIGVIVALPLMGQAIVRLGSARAVRLAGTVCCLTGAAAAAGARAVPAAARAARVRRRGAARWTSR